MKRIVLSIVAAAFLVAATSAASSILPHARRSNGDPDEFQSRQAFDQGFLVRDSELDTGTDRKPTPPESGGMKPRPRARAEMTQHVRRPLLSVGFSGKIVFLER